MNAVQKKYLESLIKKYHVLKKEKKSLLKVFQEVEISEMVYNSNAIENSTLTLPETEKILLEIAVARDVSLREVFEAKNLGKVYEYTDGKDFSILSHQQICFLHKMLLAGINDEFAGRYREKDEWVRVGSHIATAPLFIEEQMENCLNKYQQNFNDYFLESIARFHLEFETIHPFCDGNGRMGRVFINIQFHQRGLPSVIIRNSEKQEYYKTFTKYRNDGNIKPMVSILYKALCEMLHKRLAYLEDKKIIRLSEYAKTAKYSHSNILNKAKRQTLEAFREKEKWSIGV